MSTKALKRIKNDYDDIKEALEEKDYDLIHPGIDDVKLRNGNLQHWIVLIHGVKE